MRRQETGGIFEKDGEEKKVNDDGTICGSSTDKIYVYQKKIFCHVFIFIFLLSSVVATPFVLFCFC